MIRHFAAWLVALVVTLTASLAVSPAFADGAHWEKLGERTVNGHQNQIDTDTIVVGGAKGLYTHLQVKVENSALRMLDMKVHFGDGSTFDVTTAYIFGPSSTTRVIDLPGEKRVVTKVVFRYTNLNDGKGNARVELWGRDASAAGNPAPAGGGWQKLGERTVNGNADKDVIAVGLQDGLFTAVQVKVENSALRMFDMKIFFGDGSVQDVPTAYVFGPNQTTRVVDLPGNKRVIKRVEFKYGNLPGGGNARVELWGRH